MATRWRSSTETEESMRIQGKERGKRCARSPRNFQRLRFGRRGPGADELDGGKHATDDGRLTSGGDHASSRSTTTKGQKSPGERPNGGYAMEGDEQRISKGRAHRRRRTVVVKTTTRIFYHRACPRLCTKLEGVSTMGRSVACRTPWC